MHKQLDKALIIGAGIGRAALVLFLNSAGIESEVYEARELPEGFSLILASSGVALLRELGRDHAVLAPGSAVSHAMILTGKNKRLGEATRADGRLQECFPEGVPLVRVLWEGAER
ncbi:hypothetical protein A4R35_00440 [Thermogemmatispora tikiterensis]|uniref:FAD-binding domain-containing protein n=1 Tax=Thermogemmatispora tikiterensis TaxID=1825093 RepID=A0A328V8V6_9CHLR|nr:hypothetical protein A4R35_00440 [Thermogemmatispora tikiterensis]